jgi:hypothetical protein
MKYDIHIKRELEAGADMYRLKFVSPGGSAYPFPPATLPEILEQANFLNGEYGPLQVLLDPHALDDMAGLAYAERHYKLDSCVGCQGRGWLSVMGENPFVPELVVCIECNGRGLVRRAEDAQAANENPT